MHDMNMQKFTCFLMFFSNYSLKNPGKTINTTKTVKKKTGTSSLCIGCLRGMLLSPYFVVVPSILTPKYC